ncbi:MAG: hypothetical protein OIF36_00480 [Alphaproteobacteria bacterium]|nr:hypothetical protein [Alphaproteobacteria bacterium]
MEVKEAKLPYYGLHGELPNAPVKGSETVANFRKFLAQLNKLGVSQTVTQRIEKEVRKSTDLGVDPAIDLQATYIVVNNVTIPYGVNIETQGMGFVAEGIQTLFGSGFFSSLFGKQTSADEVMRDSMGRIQRMISQVSSKGLGAEEHTNKVLYNIGWLKAMHIRNGRVARSTRMKEGNAGAKRNLDQLEEEMFKELASKASFTKQRKSVTFPGSNPLLGVNTHSNPGSYFMVKITGGVRSGGNSTTGSGSQNSNPGGIPVVTTGSGNTPTQNNNSNTGNGRNNNPEPEKNNNTLLIGTLAVAAIGTAIYLGTKKKKK